MRKTQKLIQAAEILSGERYVDTSPEVFLFVAGKRRITPEQIYKAMEFFGYRWTGKSWQRIFPKWLENLSKDKRIYDTALLMDLQED